MSDAPSPDHYSMPFVRVEPLLLSIVGGKLSVLLGRREGAPHADRWAIPGGVLRIDLDHDLNAAARRVARERLNADITGLRQFHTAGGPGRDARAPWSISVVYRAMVREDDTGALVMQPGKRMKALQWWPVDSIADAKPAFDHAQLVANAVQALRDEVDRLQLPFDFLPTHFTLTQLQDYCATLLQRPLDKSSFRRRLREHDVVEPVPGEWRTGANRPAQVYRRRTRAL